jgi:hypothetical protein
MLRNILLIGLLRCQTLAFVPTYVTQLSRGLGIKDVPVPVSSTATPTYLAAEIREVNGAKPAINSEVIESSIQLLNDAISFNSSAATELLSQISGMRQMGTSREDIDEFLNNLLSTGPDGALPFWTKSKRFARFSRRARLASLRRTLDLTTPPPSESDTRDSKESLKQRRRQALVSLLRSLSSEESGDHGKERAIVALERMAKIATTADAEDLKSRLPEGLETPKYEVVSFNGNLEIRRYEPFSVCAVSMSKPRPEDASKMDAKVNNPAMIGASSFGALAGYLFGKNDQSTAMKMTTPVFTSPTSSGADEKQMAFVLPSQYWENGSLESAPQPILGSGVTLQRKDKEERAVMMFGGYASKTEIEKRKKEIMAALARDREWKAANDDMSLAQYNDPFTPPWRRLNEVSVQVIPK